MRHTDQGKVLHPEQRVSFRTWGNCKFVTECKDSYASPGKTEEIRQAEGGNATGKVSLPLRSKLQQQRFPFAKAKEPRLEKQLAGIALPASDEIEEFPRSDIRSRLMDTGCKHDLTTRDAIPHLLGRSDHKS